MHQSPHASSNLGTPIPLNRGFAPLTSSSATHLAATNTSSTTPLLSVRPVTNSSNVPGSQWNTELEKRASGGTRPYQPNLTPSHSNLRPRCPGKDRLLLWLPPGGQRPFLDAHGNPIAATPIEISRIQQVILGAWGSDTQSVYGTGLLIFHVFCDCRGTPEAQRAPASLDLISIFIATIAGSYAASTIENYVSGVRAWHTLHGMKWAIDSTTHAALIKGAAKHAPDSSKRKERLPYTPEFIRKVKLSLKMDDPMDAAVYACLTTTFYCAARLGEFTVPTLSSFKPEAHVKPSDITYDGQDRNGFKVTKFHLPRTKTSPNGADTYWTAQPGDTDPDEALRNHIQVNSPGNQEALFSYALNGRRRPLTKPAFIKRVRDAALKQNLEPLQGHGLRIGGTLKYLLRGVPFEAVKVLGRWSGDSFLRYLRRHALIMAPYLQPDLHQAFITYTMPPAR